MEQYVAANAQRERISIAKVDQPPQTQGLFHGPGQYRPSRTVKYKVLDDYDRISASILPKDPMAHTPALWHGDLHTSNISVDPLEPTRITCIIDWQAVHVGPLFMQVRHPALLEFNGPVPEGLKLPSLPENYHQLSPEERLEMDKLRSAQGLWKLYEIELLEQFKPAGQALQTGKALTPAITKLAGSVFTDGEPILFRSLIKAAENWENIVGVDSNGRPLMPCPLSYSEDEKQQQIEMQRKWETGVVLMANLMDDLGVYSGWNGLVNHGDYDAMKLTLMECKEHFLQHMAKTPEERSEWIKAWPFDSKV